MTENLPEHHSAVRSMTAKSVGKEYRAVKSLEEAQAEQDFAVIFEGDFGGQIYLTCPALEIKCNENTLHQLLLDIDDLNWEHPAAAGLYFEYLPVGSGVAGGMGGGRVTANLWIHPELHELGLANLIADVIVGRTVRLDAPTPEEMESRAANGDANAQYLLANKKRQTEPARSLELLRASASQGNLGAMSQIWRGNIAGQEKEKWLNMLAARTEADNRSQLGQACVKGSFETIDHAKATTLLLQACERQWSAYDAFQLGKMYRDGLGVQQSQVTALAWFLLASVFDVRQYPHWRIVIRRDTQPYVLESIEKLKSVMSSSSVAEAEKLSQDYFKKER